MVAHYNYQPLCVPGDSACHLNVHLQALYRTGNIIPAEQMFNQAMSKVRTSVEWLFEDVQNNFKFKNYKMDWSKDFHLLKNLKLCPTETFTHAFMGHCVLEFWFKTTGYTAIMLGNLFCK